MAQHPGLSVAEILELLKVCVELGLKEYTPENLKIAQERANYVRVIEVIDFIVGIAGMLAGLLTGVGDAPFDLMSMLLMLMIPDWFGVIAGAAALALPIISTAAIKLLKGISEIIKAAKGVSKAASPSMFKQAINGAKSLAKTVVKAASNNPIGYFFKGIVDKVSSWIDDMCQLVKRKIDDAFGKVSKVTKKKADFDPPKKACGKLRCTTGSAGAGEVGESVSKKASKNFTDADLDELFSNGNVRDKLDAEITNIRFRTNAKELYRRGSAVGDGSSMHAALVESGIKPAGFTEDQFKKALLELDDVKKPHVKKIEEKIINFQRIEDAMNEYYGNTKFIPQLLKDGVLNESEFQILKYLKNKMIATIDIINKGR